MNVWLVFVPGVIVLTDCQSQQPATGRVACIALMGTHYKTGALHIKMPFANGPVILLDTAHFPFIYQL